MMLPSRRVIAPSIYVQMTQWRQSSTLATLGVAFAEWGITRVYTRYLSWRSMLGSPPLLTYDNKYGDREISHVRAYPDLDLKNPKVQWHSIILLSALPRRGVSKSVIVWDPLVGVSCILSRRGGARVSCRMYGHSTKVGSTLVLPPTWNILTPPTYRVE